MGGGLLPSSEGHSLLQLCSRLAGQILLGQIQSAVKMQSRFFRARDALTEC